MSQNKEDKKKSKSSFDAKKSKSACLESGKKSDSSSSRKHKSNSGEIVFNLNIILLNFVTKFKYTVFCSINIVL